MKYDYRYHDGKKKIKIIISILIFIEILQTTIVIFIKPSLIDISVLLIWDALIGIVLLFMYKGYNWTKFFIIVLAILRILINFSYSLVVIFYFIVLFYLFINEDIKNYFIYYKEKRRIDKM